MARQGVTTEWTTGTAGTAGETAAWSFNIDERWNGTSRLIIALHGHGNPGTDATGPLVFGQHPTAGLGPMALARTGRYIVCSIQAAGAASWSGPAAMTAITNAIAAARTRGAKTGKYGILGYSMGGLETGNQVKTDHANIAAVWTWAPALDMDYNYSTAGHTPIASNATWTTEINTAFGGTTAAQFAGSNPAADYVSYRGFGIPWKIAHATDDSVIPISVSTSFVANVADANITMRTPSITGDHTNQFPNVPASEIVAHFDTGNWV